MDLRFVYDGWNLVQEIDALVVVESGVTDVVREYTWGLDLSGQGGNPSPAGIHGAGGIGGLLGTHWTLNTTSTSDDKAYIYFYDANGNVGQMIDHSGTTAAKYEYYPFGGLLVADGVAAEANPFRFSTKYRDNETGCYYYGERYLRTKHGRWLSRDPIEEGDFQNLYCFVTNNSINGFDPVGLYEEDVHYWLTKFLAEAVGFGRNCGILARDVAKETQAVDDLSDPRNPFGTIGARANYHFTDKARRALMFSKALSSCAATDIGEYMHALQDSYSHQRGRTDRNGKPYGPLAGHGWEGHRPDWTWDRPELANKMAKDAYEQLLAIASRCGCCTVRKKWEDIEMTVDMFNRLSMPRTKNGQNKTKSYEDAPWFKLCELFPELCNSPSKK